MAAGPSTPRLEALEEIELSTPGPTPTQTEFIQHRLDNSATDRRLSREIGGKQRLRESFERIRDEEDIAIDWTFWGAVVQDYEEVAGQRPKELAGAIQKGIPDVIRGSIWQLMSSSKSPPLEQTYKELLRKSSPHEKAITKDISRTFPTHPFFQNAVGQDTLFMVLKAYSLHDEDVGYCQGVAFIVATLLLKMPDEEAFCVLDRLMQSYNLRSHFQPDLAGLSLRLFQFERLLEDILPVLYTHFLRKGIKASMYASQWFMTLYSYRFPLPLVFRIFDVVFAEGIEAVFRFGMAILSKEEDRLLDMSFEDILAHLQADLYDDPDELVRNAYKVNITPLMLDGYASEYRMQQEAANRHAIEIDQLRNANRNLSSQLKQVEASLAAINQEHVELVRQLVESRIAREETESELVRYKLMYAELAHADEMSIHSRRSGVNE